MHVSWPFRLFALLLFVTAPSMAMADLLCTLTLDGSSHIAIDGRDPLSIPAGSTIAMRFGDPDANGDIPVAISPNDVQMLPVRLPDGRRMKYSIGGPATGSLRDDQLSIHVTIRVTLASSEGREARTYPLIFTTQQTVALNRARNRVVQAAGEGVSREARSVRLVAGVTNTKDAVVGKGAAVTAVLSGTFDRLP